MHLHRATFDSLHEGASVDFVKRDLVVDRLAHLPGVGVGWERDLVVDLEDVGGGAEDLGHARERDARGLNHDACEQENPSGTRAGPDGQVTPGTQP